MIKNLLALLFILSFYQSNAQRVFLYDSFVDRFWDIKVPEKNATEINIPWVLGKFTGLHVDQDAEEIYLLTAPKFGDGKNAIYKMDYNGNLLETINETDLEDAEDLVVDKTRGYILYREIYPNSIKRMNLDGTGVTTLASAGFDFINNFDYDQENGFVYYNGDANIYRASIEDMTIDTLYDGSSDDKYFENVAYDSENNQLFLHREGDIIPGGEPARIHKFEINSSTLSNVTVLSSSTIEKMSVNPIDGKLYWTSSEDIIERINLNGANRETALNPADYNIDPIYIGTWAGFQYLDYTSGLNNSTPSLAFELFPNPTSDGIININSTLLKNNASLKVYDSMGKLLASKMLGATNKINLELDNGIYFLEINDPISGRGFEKLLINRP